MTNSKTCTGCGLEYRETARKPLTNYFWRQAREPDGLRKRCKLCCRETPCMAKPQRQGAQMTILDQETINWISVDEQLPDDNIAVLVYAPGADEPVWIGSYDGVYWFSEAGPEYGNDEEIAARVTAWAHVPKGPG